MHARFVLSCVVVIALLLWSAAAKADLTVKVHNVLGKDAPCGPGWYELVVTVRNASPDPVEGTIVAEPSGDSSPAVETPFRVAGKTHVRVHLPLILNGDAVALFLRDLEGRHLLGPIDLPVRGSDRLLFNATGDPRVMHALLEASRRNPMPFEVRTAYRDHLTGDAILPERSPTYSCANLVLLRSDQLSRLSDGRLRALIDYVRSGGTLAVAVTREWDVRHEPLVTLVGGQARIAPASEVMMLEVRDPINDEVIVPEPFVEASLASFSGGRLRPATHGATAPFGRGHVHLLGFDPTQSPGVHDRWALARMRDLADGAVQRPRPPRQAGAWDARSPAMRQVLDPNEAGRWAVVVSVLLLIAFAILAGPVSFRRCVRRGRPLQPFWLLPLWSILFFGVVLIVGSAVKGWPGHARQLAFVEAESGSSRAPAVRFHALFRAEPGPFAIRSFEPDGSFSPSEPGQTLQVGSNGMRLVGTTTAPWSVVVAREDGFTNLGEGVRVVPEDDDVRISNRSGRDLRAVVLVLASSDLRLFDTVANGKSVVASEGASAGRIASKRGELPKPLVNRLNDLAPGLGDAWRAVGASRTNVYRADVPIALAMVDGPCEQLDGPLPLERRHILLRVAGEGGEP